LQADLGKLVKDGDYISYGREGNRTFDWVYGVGKVLRADASLLRVDTWEWSGTCLAEQINLDTILTSTSSDGNWTKKEKIVDINQFQYELGDARLKSAYLLVEGWLKYGWQNLMKLSMKELEADVKRRRKEYEEFIAEHGTDAKKYTDEQLAFLLPYEFIAKYCKERGI